eukprot:m51a1_g13377 putative spermidine synthase (290) ;mRNA; r:278-1381
MDALKAGWFSELGVMWPGISQSLEIEKVLHTERSKYQDIMVLQTKTFGRMMTLDGVIQLTERDEFAYHEMLAHVSCLSHPHPRRVLIIGGGDGGVVRELVKHDCIERIDLCDIDERVTAVSKEYFPTVNTGLSDPRLHCYFEDGAAFVQRVAAGQQGDKYDIIVTDSSDPVGPAEVLYRAEYYTSLLHSLNPGGIVCSQAESMWLHADVIKRLVEACRRAGFKQVEYANIMIPTYPCGSIGGLYCRVEGSCKKPVRAMSDKMAASMKYYNAQIHEAAFAVPSFIRPALE